MRKITLLFILFMAFGYKCNAQAVSSYLFNQSSEAYSAVIGTNSTAAGDDGSQNSIPIGFSFSFGGVDYNTFSISTNGFIRLGNNIGGNNWINGLSNTSAQAPVLAIFWDDNNRNNGAIQYNVSGIAPNRSLEVGWDVVNIGNNGQVNGAVSGSFKMRLHETTGVIEYIYGSTMTWSGGITASIGLGDMSSFISVTPASGNATVSSVTANNAITATEFIVNNKYTFTPVPVCSGTPNPGNTISTIASTCSNQDFILSLQNQGNGYGLIYQWQSSSDGVNYTDVPNAMSSELTLTQSAATYYQCIVTCNGASATSTPVQVNMNPLSACYCFPSYGIGKEDGDLISNVVITGTTLSNNTGTDPVNPYYTYFTGQPNYTATLQAGMPYQINVTVGSYGEQNSAVWIDYNDDTVFSPDERVGYTENPVGSFETAGYAILLGCDAPAGIHRMRIRDVYNVEGMLISPCDNYGYGETEDYDVTIIGASSCGPAYDLNTGTINSSTAQLLWTAGCGQLTWDVHVTIAGGGLPSGTASNPDINENSLIVSGLSPSTNYEFYVLSHCGANGDGTWAGPFAFTTAPMAVANDDCDNAFVLTPGGNFEEHALVATNAGASQSIGSPMPTCAVFGFGGDVWFSVVVPASGSITVETQSEPGSPLLDTGLTLFSGACNALTSLGCSDDEGIGAFSLITLTGLTPGETIYARVWEYANDTFGAFRVSAWDASLLGTNSFNTNGFAYYPNPVKNTLNLSSTANITEVKVFNLLGQVMSKEVGSNLNQIDMSSLSKGTYMVKVTSDNQSKTIKVIKE